MMAKSNASTTSGEWVRAAGNGSAAAPFGFGLSRNVKDTYRFMGHTTAMRQGDTPDLISPYASLLQDQDEKAQCDPSRRTIG
jgi:hypothetical protein